jgi:NAD(P)H-binding
MAVTVAAGRPCGKSPQGRSGQVAARTPLPPTTWATLPACGSPSCAGAAGTPHPITQCKSSRVTGTRPHPGRAAPSPAPEPKPPARLLPPRRGRSRGCCDARLAPESRPAGPVLVTGASGTIGRRLVPALVAAGHQVRAITRSDAAAQTAVAAGAEPVHGDLTDPASLSAATRGCQLVIHAAGRMGPSSAIEPFWPAPSRSAARTKAGRSSSRAAPGTRRPRHARTKPSEPPTAPRWPPW